GTDGAELVDFTGDGLPDVLQLRGSITRYFRNRGDGSWDRPRTLRSVPAGVDLSTPGISFADMNGDGIADIVVTQGVRPGFYPLLGKERFDRYQAFDRIPELGLSDANTRQIDLDADGIVDVLHTGERAFVALLREGKSGWSQPRVVPRLHDPAQFP